MVTWLLPSGRSQGILPFWRSSAQPLDHAMGEMDRQGHERVGFVGGVAEHQALVAGALFAVVVLGLIDAAGDVGGLAVNRGENAAALVVEADFRMNVADLFNRVARHLGGVNVRLGRHLTGEHNLPRGDQRFASHAGVFVLGKDGVQDGVADLVGHLIGMTHGDGFAGE